MAKKPTIAIQGIRASFHEEAALAWFGPEIRTIECMTFKKMFEDLKSGNADYIVMAIENSIAGSLLPNYSLLQDYNFPIIGEIFLPVQLHLLALPGVRFEDIKYVQSHPIAIRQCEEFLQDFQGITVLEKSDTAACAQEIQEKQLKDTVAIANLTAAKAFGLEVLERRIESNKKNYTRFLIISREHTEISNTNKASVCFRVNNNPGSLAKVLTIFAQQDINLSKIQSMPVLGKPNEYNFYVDLEWSEQKAYDLSLRKILKYTHNLSVMGEYRSNDTRK
ncbi:MAG TPA: prephenate dehydratase [Anseongella sp.]